MRPARARGLPASARGFTLMELMIVVAIVAVLATIAYPAYTPHLGRGHRAEARTALLEAQLYMTRFHAVHGRYTTEGGEPPVLPLRLRTAPEGARVEAARYQLSVSEATEDGYTLKAALAPGRDDPCGDLTLTHSGVQGRGGEVWTVADCWR